MSSAPKWRVYKRQRFAEVLASYMSRHGLTQKQLAELIGRPLPTVRAWLKGRRLPVASAMRRMCDRMAVDYESLFGNGPARDWFFEKQVLGVDVLQHRYLEVLQSDALSALGYVTVMGAVVFNALSANLECRLTVSSAYQVTVHCQIPALQREFGVLISARNDSGIGYLVVDGRGHHEWTRLSVRSLVELKQWFLEIK